MALETRCGRDGDFRIEWEVEGRGLRNPSCGRGGSGGGVPSLDGATTLLAEALRDMLLMMLSVGFAKSCCETFLAAFLKDALLLSCVGVEGALSGEAAPSGSALPVSGIKTVVTVSHQGSWEREDTSDMALVMDARRRDAIEGNRGQAWRQEIRP